MGVRFRWWSEWIRATASTVSAICEGKIAFFDWAEVLGSITIYHEARIWPDGSEINARGRPTLPLGQRRVDLRHHRRAFADGGGDPLGRAAAHVADREHARAAGFEGQRRAARRRRPCRSGRSPFRRARRSRAASRCWDRRRRTGTGGDSSQRCSAPVARSRKTAPESPVARSPSRPTTSVPMCSVTLGSARDALDQIARHRGFEAAAADDQVQLLHLRREEDDGLARGVAAAHQRDLLALAQLGLDRARPSRRSPAPSKVARSGMSGRR